MKNRYTAPSRVCLRFDRKSFRNRREAGFFNPRALLGLTLCFVALALAIFAAREIRRAVHRSPPGTRLYPTATYRAKVLVLRS